MLISTTQDFIELGRARLLLFRDHLMVLRIVVTAINLLFFKLADFNCKCVYIVYIWLSGRIVIRFPSYGYDREHCLTNETPKIRISLDT